VGDYRAGVSIVPDVQLSRRAAALFSCTSAVAILDIQGSVLQDTCMYVGLGAGQDSDRRRKRAEAHERQADTGLRKAARARGDAQAAGERYWARKAARASGDNANAPFSQAQKKRPAMWLSAKTACAAAVYAVA
jgi:sRNA-binding protein